MKRNIYLLIILTVFILTGCSPKDQMTNFIPTPMPSDDDALDAVEDEIEDVAEGTEGEVEATPTPKPLHVGKTTEMYVKLDKYGAFLNVRPNPSTDGEPVGFLVHAEKIEVIELVEGWASFVYNEKVCYVNADFLQEKRPEYLTPPTPTPVPEVTPTMTPTAEPTTEQTAPEI
jgi:hypothetical protein